MAYLVQLDTILFKRCVYQKFPNGAWAAITSPHITGNVWGMLWIAPSFTYTQLANYFSNSFGANVSAGKMLMPEVQEPAPDPAA